MDYSGFGMRIRQKRKELNFTQADLAEMCNCSIPFIGHIERGSRAPSMESLIMLCNALKGTPDYLLQDYLDISSIYRMMRKTELDDITNMVHHALSEIYGNWPD